MGARNDWGPFFVALAVAIPLFSALPAGSLVEAIPWALLLVCVALVDALLPDRNLLSVTATIGLPALAIYNPLVVFVTVLMVHVAPMHLLPKPSSQEKQRLSLSLESVVSFVLAATMIILARGVLDEVSVLVAAGEGIILVAAVLRTYRQTPSMSLGVSGEESRLLSIGVLSAVAYASTGAVTAVLYEVAGGWAFVVALGLYCVLRQSVSLAVQVNQAHLGLASALASAIDEAISMPGHSQRVSHLSEKIGVALGLPRRLVMQMRLAALLHDISHLNEYGDEEEPDRSLTTAILKSSSFLQAVAPIISRVTDVCSDDCPAESMIAAYVIHRAGCIDEQLLGRESSHHVSHKVLDLRVPSVLRARVDSALQEVMTGA